MVTVPSHTLGTENADRLLEPRPIAAKCMSETTVNQQKAASMAKVLRHLRSKVSGRVSARTLSAVLSPVITPTWSRGA